MRKLSTVLMKVYNSPFYVVGRRANSFTARESGYLCVAANSARDAGIISPEERLVLREAIAAHLTYKCLCNQLGYVGTASPAYAKDAMKFWRSWRRELQAAGK